MNVPTQAQIEAAKKAIEAATISLKDFSKWSEVAATAALTAAAAAGVGHCTYPDCLCVYCDKPAAAEVGGQAEIERLRADFNDCNAARARWREKSETAIERCAQVAENCELNDIDRDSPGTAIAAAIRALKE